MTDEQKRIIQALRDDAILQRELKNMTGIEIKSAGVTAEQCDKAADLIEHLAEENERVKRELDAALNADPCTLCSFCPPSGRDGNPCVMCPATGRG